METEVFDRSVKLCRVKGSNLDPKKLWYVLTESLCGIRPNAFAKSEISRQFPNEIWSVPPAGLKPAKNGCSFNTRQSGNSYVVSSFGICAGLLRQREFPAHGFVRSQNIIPVVNAVNGMALNFEIADSLGGKYLMEVMSKCQSRIAELDHEIRELERSNSYLNSFMPCYPPLAASSPSSSLNNECYKDSRDISSFSSPCSTSGPYSISGP